MKHTVSQESFLCNAKNKTRLIALIGDIFAQRGIPFLSARGDADYLISSTALQVSSPVLVVATDTDILVYAGGLCSH